MKRFSALLASAGAALLLSSAAPAQDASQIAAVRDLGENCTGCNLFQADFAYRDMPDRDLSGSRLRQANLSLSTMNNANFSGANLSVANLFGARMSSADMSGANLTDAVLVGAYLGYADMTGADLSEANLSGADFTGATGLTQVQLDMACGDTETVLPAGLTIPACPTPF